MKKVNKYKQGLLTSKDILTGYKAFPTGTDFWTTSPIQCIPEKEKDEYWIKHNADWFENIAIRELPKKAREYQKLANMRSGIINKSDYVYGEDVNSSFVQELKDDTQDDLLNMFFPIAPNIHNVFLGEFMKRDKSCIVDAVDEESVNEVLAYKEQQIKEVLGAYAQSLKAESVPRETEEEQSQFMKEMETAKRLSDIEQKFKKFRTRAAKWANRFIEKFNMKHGMDEIIERLFSDAITYDEYIFRLDLREDDFVPVYMDPRKTFVLISPTKVDYSDSAAVINVEFMSLPEIINTFRNKLTQEQIEILELNYNTTISNTILSAGQMSTGSGYYDTSVSYEENMRYGTNVRQTISSQAIDNLFTDSGTNPFNSYSSMFSNMKLIRVTNVWWCSQKKMGLLTSIDEDGNLFSKEVDENFIVTEKPVYDNSLLREKSAKTLVKGEHVEWSYINDWRHVIKIGRNVPANVIESDNMYKNIYVGGDSIKFQFKSTGNHYDSKPPIQGRRLSDISTARNSLINKLKPWQIHYNIVMNKVLPVLRDDIGPVLYANESDAINQSLEETDGLEPMIELVEKVRNTKVLINRDLDTANRTNGRSREARIIDISTIDKVQSYLNIAMGIKQQAFDSIGVSPQRLANIGKSESATGVQQAVDGSVNQTEIYFNAFLAKGLPKIWQMIVDAGQWYTSKNESFVDSYINNDEDRILIEVAQEDLFRDLLVKVIYSAQSKEFLTTIKQLAMQDNTMGATFVDKVKTLKAKTPSEIIEQLELAEFKKQEQEMQKYEEERKLAMEREQAALQRQQEMMKVEIDKFYDKLSNDYNIALVKAELQSTPPDNTVDMLKADNQMQIANQSNQLEREKIQSERDMADKNYDLKLRELDNKRRDSELKYAIAVENKQKADLQFKKLTK